MRTYLDCIPCFFKQTLEASRLAGADMETQKQILNDVARIIPELSLELTPPEMGRIIHNLIKQYTGKSDPYRAIKEKSNRFATAICEKIKSKLERSDDRLLTAVRMAIFSNIIDFGPKNNLNIDEEINRILNDEFPPGRDPESGCFHYRDFRRVLNLAGTILYLADNAGETVFDRILMEEILRMDPGKKIIYAVKEKPIINDAVRKDALDSGIDGVAEIVTSGSDAPGTIPALCSDAFLQLYEKSDMVISKGQGNFEGLSDEKREIFFLLIAKCPVIARDIGSGLGEIILIHHDGNEGKKAVNGENRTEERPEAPVFQQDRPGGPVMGLSGKE